jgi:hypothetical protein
MTTLRSAAHLDLRRLRTLGGRRQEINNKAFRHAHARSAAPLQPSAIRNSSKEVRRTPVPAVRMQHAYALQQGHLIV